MFHVLIKNQGPNFKENKILNTTLGLFCSIFNLDICLTGLPYTKLKVNWEQK